MMIIITMMTIALKKHEYNDLEKHKYNDLNNLDENS